MKNRSIFTQITILLFLIAVIPVSLIIYFNGRFMQKNFETMTAKQVQERLSADARLCDTILQNVMNLSIDVVRLKQYKPLENVDTYEELNSQYVYVEALLRLYESLQNMANRNPEIRSAYYYREDADYVVTSGAEPVVKKENFQNLEWLKEIEKQIKGAQGLWVSHNIEGAKGTEEVNSFVYRVSSLYTSARGIMVVDVYADNIAELIMDGTGKTLKGGGLVTSQGDILCVRGEMKQDIERYPVYKEILSSKEKTGWGILNTEGEKSLYTWQTSRLYDWRYINVYSLDILFDNPTKKLWYGIASACAMLLAGVIVAVLIMYKTAKSLYQILQEIRTVAKISEDDLEGRNEVANLGRMVEKIRNQESELNRKLHERENAALRAAVQKILVGEKLPRNEEELLKKTLPYNHFIACILMVDGLSQYYQNTTHELREYHRCSVMDMVKTIFPQHVASVSGRYSSSVVAIVLNVQEFDRSETMRMVMRALQTIQEQTKKTLDISLSAGVSSVHNRFENVWICVNEAFSATKRRMFKGSGSILFYHENGDGGYRAFPSYLYEKKLFNYLEIGDMDHIKEELRKMGGEMCSTDALSEDTVMLIFNQIIGKLIIYMNEKNYNANSVFGVKHNLYQELGRYETVEGMTCCVEKMFDTLLTYQNQQYSGNEENTCQRVLLYLQEHYQEDVDFDELAGNIGISYSYLRKVIKQETEKSLIDNLNLIRVEAAKKALLETELSIAEIATRNGYHNVQALNRFFKKFEGMTPGEYRERYQTKQKNT